VKDRSTKVPIENVNVHIINSLSGSATNVDCFYQIKNLECGEYNVIISCVGYYHKVENISLIEDENLEINFFLAPNAYELETVNVTDSEDDEWINNFEIFRKEFIGEPKMQMMFI
jgi:hypothetical protein